ncbi:MAG TPA: hypothetical protein VN905_12250 [Candidatus Binatia bacterium]|nr:hypothetical protein [Candidatus Binatia bacterium]
MRAPKGERRRYAASYAISIVLHLALIVFFLGSSGLEAGGPESENQPVVAQLVTITHEQRPTLTITREARPAKPAPPAPQRKQTPAQRVAPPAAIVQRPAPAPTSAPPVPRAQRELAKTVKTAPVQAHSTPVPQAVAVAGTPVAQPPSPPTAPPEITPTAEPARVAATVPPDTSRIVPRPTATIPPDTARIVARAETPAPAEPTSPPTVTPRTPAPEPTRAPTAAPTAAPTRAPTIAPTSAPRVVATAVPTAQAVAVHTPGPAPTAAAARAVAEESGAQKNAAAPVAAPLPVARAATPAPVAFVQPTNAPQQRSAAELLNERLKSLTLNVLLPRSEVNYSQKHYGGDDIALLGQRIEQEWQAKIAPPLSIIGEIFGIVKKPTTDLQAASVTYLYKHGIFGLCYGWYVIEHPLSGGHPEGGYTILPCGHFTPVTPGSLTFPSASPSPGPRPQATAAPRG